MGHLAKNGKCSAKFNLPLHRIKPSVHNLGLNFNKTLLFAISFPWLRALYSIAVFLKPWVAKPCKLPHVKEEDLRAQDMRSEEPS